MNFGHKLTELLESTPTFGKSGTFGKFIRFWKPTQILETHPGFGNLPRFWKPTQVLETHPGFGNPPGFWKPTQVLETYSGLVYDESLGLIPASTCMKRFPAMPKLLVCRHFLQAK